jgi:thioredoxin-like negative regulator of GroEL
MKPTVRRLEEEYKDRVEFRALNIDDAANAQAMKQYKFRGQPQFVVVKSDGAILDTKFGTQSYEDLKSMIDRALAS